ncbi:MAG TPA: hypothetical protein VHG29_00040 [Novosphingobium sp.]|nr:hypothetical protein [Novosphingobium sp.]
MATRPIGNDAAPVTLPGSMPPIPAVARILARFDRDQLHGFIAVAIDLADAMEPDSDLEPDGDDQDSDGDERGDQAWVEWTSMRRDAGRQHNECLGEEDDELAGDETDAEGCEDDHLPPRMQSAANRGASAAGCIISDPDFCLAGDDRIGSGSLTGASLLYEDKGPGDADDAEIWQMCATLLSSPKGFSAAHIVAELPTLPTDRERAAGPPADRAATDAAWGRAYGLNTSDKPTQAKSAPKADASQRSVDDVWARAYAQPSMAQEGV